MNLLLETSHRLSSTSSVMGEKGQSLISSTDIMVDKSTNGQKSVKKIQLLIERLGEESKQTAQSIEEIIVAIDTVKTDVNDVLKTIKEQETLSESINHEISKTAHTFEETNQLIQQHIDEAAQVEQQLKEGMDQLQQLQK